MNSICFYDINLINISSSLFMLSDKLFKQLKIVNPLNYWHCWNIYRRKSVSAIFPGLCTRGSAKAACFRGGYKLEFSVDVEVSWIFREMIFHIHLPNTPQQTLWAKGSKYAHNRHKTRDQLS